MTRIVCDTNVLVSGLLWRGAPRRVLAEVEKGHATMFTCQEMLYELGMVLSYPKLAQVLKIKSLAPDDVLRWVVRHASIVLLKPLPEPVIIADPSDDYILACADAAVADVVVTGDKHLLHLGHHGRTLILRPAAWLEKRNPGGRSR